MIAGIALDSSPPSPTCMIRYFETSSAVVTAGKNLMMNVVHW